MGVYFLTRICAVCVIIGLAMVSPTETPRPLSPPLRELIKLLAEIAVQDFCDERQRQEAEPEEADAS